MVKVVFLAGRGSTVEEEGWLMEVKIPSWSVIQWEGTPVVRWSQGRVVDGPPPPPQVSLDGVDGVDEEPQMDPSGRTKNWLCVLGMFLQEGTGKDHVAK